MISGRTLFVVPLLTVFLMFLCRDIVGLNELGRQLAVGVGEQQEQIDVIEDKVEGASEDVNRGGRALQLVRHFLLLCKGCWFF